MKTEKEILINQRKILHKIEAYVKDDQLAQLGDFIPGMLHFNRKEDLHIQYLNPAGLEICNTSLDYIQQNGEVFFSKFIHESTFEEVFPALSVFTTATTMAGRMQTCK